jgi:hypothetical protein
MGMDKPERKPVEPSKANDLSGNESAQRKRFIRSEEEDSGNQKVAWSSIEQLIRARMSPSICVFHQPFFSWEERFFFV